MPVPIDPAEKFVDNWAYLKTELNWLDRVLTLAVARQRKETKEIDRIAQSRADRVTSHWWKGVISLDTTAAYDEHRQTAHSGPIAKLTYPQQIELRVRASQQQGIVLGLPLLCERLQLTTFDKHLILLSLAPEVNRRYARLYRYLQGDESVPKTDLPTVDLAMRLFCRNDQEWQLARARLTAKSPLRQLGLLQLHAATADTLLNQTAQLSEPLIDYLLSEQPTAQHLDRLLAVPAEARLRSEQVPIEWSMLVLPVPLHHALQQIARRLMPPAAGAATGRSGRSSGGSTVLLTGAAGTGKTLAARAIAHALELPLVSADLALWEGDDAALWETITAASPDVLLLQSAHRWFGRTAALPDRTLARLLDWRRRLGGLTLLETRSDRPIRPVWQQQLDAAVELPLPQRCSRLQLWQRSLPSHLPLAIDWQRLAQIPLSGGEIEAATRDAIGLWTASGDTQLTLTHLKQALRLLGKR